MPATTVGNLARSYIVGDKLIDLECGWNAGVKRSIVVRTGYGADVERESGAALRDAVLAWIEGGGRLSQQSEP